MQPPEFLYADWPAPANVHALVTTRRGGVSESPYDTFNLAHHVGDNPAAVMQNRERLRTHLRLPSEPVWLEQVHGVQVINAAEPGSRQADAAFTQQKNMVCAVMTADCLPVLICDRRGTQVAAAHAGWRGLHAGVIEATLKQFSCSPRDLLVWLGPAIGPEAFEVGDEVRNAFIQDMAQSDIAFRASRPGHWLANIYELARLRLQRYGIDQIYGGGLCTYHDRERFYSYRRDGKTGRMASLIWRV
ncbi:MAG: peptidoglycan editing factor PgeF [Gammaproteobacteria bacterium]|nr:MAG: peptidoglycan editing factor PgeF [Gammaproteobacteria bacterium]